jgi:hypothetical protein
VEDLSHGKGEILSRLGLLRAFVASWLRVRKKTAGTHEATKPRKGKRQNAAIATGSPLVFRQNSPSSAKTRRTLAENRPAFPENADFFSKKECSFRENRDWFSKKSAPSAKTVTLFPKTVAPFAKTMTGFPKRSTPFPRTVTHSPEGVRLLPKGVTFSAKEALVRRQPSLLFAPSGALRRALANVPPAVSRIRARQSGTAVAYQAVHQGGAAV